MACRNQLVAMSGRGPPPPDLFAEEVVAGSDGISLAFPVGILHPNLESEDTFELIVICVEERGVLVALPKAAWDKKASNRKLPQGAIVKPISIVCQISSADDRLQPLEGGLVGLWLGWLNPVLVESVRFGGDTLAKFGFVDQDTADPCYPFADSLVQAATERFQIRPGVQEENLSEKRLDALEEKFSTLQDGLEKLLAFHAPKEEESGFVTAAESLQKGVSPKAPATRGATSKASPSANPPGLTAPPGLSQVHAYPGLDPSAVAAALQAGVSEEHLRTMSRVVMNKPGKMQDVPLSSTQVATPNVVELEEEDPASGGASNMTEALLKLTEIVTKLTGRRSDSLEDAMDSIGGSGSMEGSIGLSRKHAALINALKKTFREEPKKIWTAIETNMANEFDLRVAQPNVPGLSFTARGWAEHRSRIQGYARTVRSTWTLAGVLDALRDGRQDEARARCCLGLAQLEQESLNHGSFLLAQEFALEPPAPISSFQQHCLPDAAEMAHTRLLDSHGWMHSPIVSRK